jgi:hypothetical protein
MKIGDEVSWWSALQHVATLRPNPVPTFCHPGIPARYAPRGNGPREPFSSAPLGGPKWTWAGQKEKVIHKKRRCQALTRGANSSIHICICILYIYYIYNIYIYSNQLHDIVIWLPLTIKNKDEYRRSPEVDVVIDYFHWQQRLIKMSI